MQLLARYSVIPLVALLWSCSSTGQRQAKIYQAGEKATVDKLTFAVIDTQIHPRLGEDPNNPRIPQNRFYVIQIATSSGNNADVPIPPMTLVDDSGKSYPELADGAGLKHWMGVVRTVSPAQTERGEILFDAPAAHYKLKLTSETDPDDVYIDLPLNFVNEQMSHEGSGVETAPAPGLDPGAPVSPGAPATGLQKKK